MKIAIIGAAGNAGRRIVDEALSRGHDVTALGPTEEKLTALGAQRVEVGDVNEPDEIAAKLSGHDVVVSAVRFVRYDPATLLSAVSRSGVPRLLVVGGAGSLRTASGDDLADTPLFPEAAKLEAAAGRKLLERLRTETAVDWTFLSPSAMFTAGERTGSFRLGGDDLLIGTDGKSRISFEDFAVALLDEIEKPAHPGRRFTVGY